MDVICVATADGRAYYSIVMRLRKAGFVFKSVTPSELDSEKCSLILTTKKELDGIDGTSVAIEELNENPVIMKGQIIARLRKVGRRELLVGIDPGSRIGVAVFYQNLKLASLTFNSVAALLNVLEAMVRSIPHSKLLVKVGSGAPKLSKSLARVIRSRLDTAVVEMVDEKGTSSNHLREKELTRDQFAAAKIAYRKGVQLA